MDLCQRLSEQDICDLLDALDRADEDLGYSKDWPDNYSPEDLPDLAAKRDRWAVLRDRLISAST